MEIKKLKIKKSNFRKLKKRYNWKGDGTKENPLIIESTKDMPGLLYFKTKGLYVESII